MSKTKELFWTFFKIGAFTFGGGYAMVALLQNEFVEEKKATRSRVRQVRQRPRWRYVFRPSRSFI